jgi:hypothetical protein
MCAHVGHDPTDGAVVAVDLYYSLADGVPIGAALGDGEGVAGHVLAHLCLGSRGQPSTSQPMALGVPLFPLRVILL